MEQSSLKEIMKALSMHSQHIQEDMRGMEKRLDTKINNLEKKLDTRITNLENTMDKRFDRLDGKLTGMCVELNES